MVGKSRPQYRLGWYVLFAGILAIAAWRRLVELTHGFDGDEVFSLSIAGDNWRGFIARALHDRPHPPLHLILLRGWISLFGSSEVAARSLSVVLSLGAVAFVLIMLKRRVGMPTAAVIGLVIAVSSFFVHFGQEARPYALLMFLAAFNLWSFLNVLENPRKRVHVWSFAAGCLLLVYCQYLGTVTVAAEIAVLGIRYPLRTAIAAATPAAVATLLIVPWWWLAFHGGTSMPSLAWNVRPGPADLFYVFLGGIGWPPYVARYLLLGFCAVIFALACAYSRRRLANWEVAALAALAIVPTCIVFILSFHLQQSIWAPRQLIPSVLAFLLAVALFIEGLPQYARPLSGALLVLWAIAGYSDGLESRRTPPWLEIVRTIENNSQRATVLSESPWGLRPLSHYTNARRIKIVDSKKYNANMNAPLYLVCRFKACHAFLENHSLSGLREVRSDEWDYRGGQPRGLIITYRLR